MFARVSPLVCAILAVLLFPLARVEAAKGTLRVGVARVDITPAEGAALPMSGYGSRTEGFKSIHDPLHARVIVVDDGAARAIIISWDLIFVPQQIWKEYTQRIAAETGVPREHILMAATHTHGGPDLRKLAGMEPGSPGRLYLDELQAKAIQAVRQAQAALQPGRIGFGAGKASVNMNRRARMADGTWGLGNNPDGPSDKTVAVVRFENANGEPVAFLINYAVHGTVLGSKNYEITADLPGATSRIVEEHFGGGVVAAFTAGASGDQDPIYRVGIKFSERDALAQILAEEVIRVAKTIKTAPYMEIRGTQRVVTCPGKKSPPGPRPKDGKYVFLDADPVDIRLSALMLNHLAITGVSGEVLTMIGARVKDESPFSRTIFVTHANGASGYVPDDNAYDQVSYEIVATKLKRGCAEDAVVNGLLDMMDGL